MAKNDKQLHIAMFPWLAFGHIIPYFELAKIIAEKGHIVTFISTPRNINRLPKFPPHLNPFLNLVGLPLLPKHKANLPENAESTMDIPSNKIPYLQVAYEGLQESLFELLKTTNPNWIFYDFTAHFVPPLANTLQIPCAYFYVCPAWNVCFLNTAKPQLENPADARTKPEDFFGPPKWVPFPSKIGLKHYEVMKFFTEIKETYPPATFKFGKAISSCDLLAFRSCPELESEWLNLLGELHNKPVLPVGLIPPSLQVRMVDEEDNNPVWLKIKSWLDKQGQGSVVYVAFGSQVKFTQEDLTELALGLELSGLPFLWALRKIQDSSADLPNEFGDRIKDRGLVCREWVPQLKILEHESVGAYFTHCGGGSVLEGLNFGHVLVTLPFLLDQSLYARVLEEKKLGIEIPRNDRDGSFTRSSVAKSLRLAMVDKEGSIYRKNAKEMGLVVSDRDRHDRYIENYLKYLQNYNKAQYSSQEFSS
ncbi:UDP-glycosyltransferase [Quillaja saponaria]|uniref:UDP-glycosyltransferase n=1 Tax=Quillaja saponaria TaxID=32244 RepID=A0AAD7LUX2_QUISA|nr:UDP-glycosyltransferase [Quillaja saponaria]